MPENSNHIPCYNRGCGQMFDPKNNDKDECRHHPGVPVFHDAYKGWSCCNKKSVDFTEFLNIKGCTLSKHSNVKPVEPEKKDLDEDLKKKEVVEVRAPVKGPQLVRPPFDSPMTIMQPKIADSLMEFVHKTTQKETVADNGAIAIGTSCKNGGCSASYQGPQSNNEMCTYHPGCPIFHEGMKYWSCCQKKTSDFNVFLSQPGCTSGVHKWTKEGAQAGTVKCRWDWHQTPEHVIVSVYAKNYNPSLSYVKLNPIRLNTKVVFSEQDNAVFELDLELRGVVSVDLSSASMLGTKVEVKLKKAEPGAWPKLDFPRPVAKHEELHKEPQVPIEDDSVDLSSIEAVLPGNRVNVVQ